MNASSAITVYVVTGLWEGVLIAAIVWLGLRALPKLGAATRYAIWLAALTAIAILPLMTTAGSTTVAQPTTTESLPISQDAPPNSTQRTRAAITTPTSVTSYRAPAAALPVHFSALPIGDALANVIAIAAILAGAVRALRLTIDVIRLVRLRRSARPWSTAHGYSVAASDRVAVPMAFGLRNPVIMVPASLVEALPPGNLDDILEHEAAHLRRGDVFTNGLARLLEIALALNPAAWFVLRRLSREREIACDDWVVERSGTGNGFAHTLASLACGTTFRSPIAAPSALGSRHALIERIERLLDPGRRRLQISPPALATAVAIMVAAALGAQTLSPVLAFEPTRPSESATSTAANAACPEPNRPLSLIVFDSRKAPKDRIRYPLPAGDRAVARFGAKNTVLYKIAVDASGKLTAAQLVSPEQYPGEGRFAMKTLRGAQFQPALRDCRPVATTMVIGYRYRTPEPWTLSVITPLYPSGWTASHPNACKVPTVTHANYRPGFVRPGPYADDLPTYPDAMKSTAPDPVYTTTVHVRVDDAGHAAHVALERSSGQHAFDIESIAAAQKATLPLDPTTCVRPPAYVWYTTYRWQPAF